MSDKKISQFNELTTATNADLIPIVDVATNETKFITKENLIPNASFIENIVVKTQADATLELDKINWVTLINDHTISAPTPDASNLGKIIIVNNRSSSYSLTITGLVVMPVILNGYNSIIGIVCVTDGVDYGWEVFSRYNLADFDLISQTITNGVTDKSPSEDAVFDALALKLDLSGANANQDIDIDGFGVNAKHFKVNGTAGAGHIGLKHQSADISASASESSIGADIVGDPVWKNDGGAIDKLELQSNKTSTVTGNEASTSKYLTVKGVYDWALGLFARLTGGQLTGALNEAPTVTIASATTTNIGGANSASVDISGTTTITGLGTVANGIIRNVRFTGALTLTHNATSLILPNATNTTTQNGDTAIFRSLGSGNWICVSYKSVTALTTDRVTKWDGSKLVNSNFGENSLIGTGSGTRSYIVGKTVGADSPSEFRYFRASGADYFAIAADGSNMEFNMNLYIFRSSDATSPMYLCPKGVAAFSYKPILALTTDATNLQSTFAAYHNPTNTYTLVSNSSGQLMLFAINDTVGTLINAIHNRTGIRQGSWYNGGLLVGSGTKLASAALQVESTTQGFLPPRMTNAQRTAIASPSVGLMVYCTDATEGLYIYKSTGWIQII